MELASEVKSLLSGQVLREFCLRWKIIELAIFGSAAQGQLEQQSDLDVLVTFEESAKWSLFDMMEMQQQLEQVVGRRVDLVEKQALVNSYRKRHILQNHIVVYAA